MSLPNRNVRKILTAMSPEELAIQYVILTTGGTRTGKLYSAQDLLTELTNRGFPSPIYADIKIQEARETMAMCGDEDAIKQQQVNPAGWR